MPESIFAGIFDTTGVAVITPVDFLICLGVSLAIGLLLAMGYAYKTEHTKSFVTTLALLPAVVCIVIMMVNGNIGAGVAVAGAFSLVRFRSVPGTAREIVMLFLAMGAGLVAGMGYLFYAFLFSVIMCLAFLIYTHVGAPSSNTRSLRVTIPEDLNYTDVFDSIFAKYTTRHELIKVKTVNMGSLFRLHYRIVLKNSDEEKELIDALRERNGNLEIMISRPDGEERESL